MQTAKSTQSNKEPHKYAQINKQSGASKGADQTESGNKHAKGR
jgi:hypothetical protein